MSSVLLTLQLIIQKEMYSQQAVNAYLIHRFLTDLVPRVLPPATRSEKFYAKHADDKGDHILMDENFNIRVSSTGSGLTLHRFHTPSTLSSPSCQFQISIIT